MNLNEHVFNKPKTKFITTGKCVGENRIDIGNASLSTDSRIYFSKQKSKQKRTKNQTSSNWGSACISVQPSTTSSRKSSNTNITNEAQTRTIIALTEGRGQARCEVGMACLNISSPVLVICQISDTQDYFNTLTKINILNPTEILFPNTFEKFSSRLITKIKEKFPKLKYTAMVRSAFNKINGLDILSQLCIRSLNGILLVLRHRYYALAASSALLTYIQDNLYIFYAQDSLKIEYQESEGFTLIDIATADRLELVCCAKPAQGNKYSSLLGILNYCQTKVGSRMLRSWILQPPFNAEYIRDRLDCVDEIISNRVLLVSLQGFLQKLSNVDSLLSLSTLVPQDPHKCTARQLNYILHLNGFTDLVNPLKDLLANFKQAFFVNLRETLDDPGFKEIRDMLRESINEDAQSSKGEAGIYSIRCYAIKPGINSLLDIVRKIYSERINDMKEYVEILANKYNLALSLNNNQKKGYHILLMMNKQQKQSLKTSDLPPEFIEVQRTASSITMKTPELINISVRVEDILEDILKISNVIVYNIMVNLKKHISLFYTLCEEVARLDVYQSLAQTSLENNYIRPEFGTYTEIKYGTHPLLNFLLPTKPVANSIFCSDDVNVHIITGPNGSGKSIFIRQMMLLQVMAQLGSHVPAEYAIFKPVKKMFARICLDDNMEDHESSFVLEMKEIKYIMSTMTNDALIIIDELGRSTSVNEGKSIAIAILEQMSCFTSLIFVTTHFMLLAKLNLMYPHIKTWQMETIPDGDDPKTFKLDYKYRLIPGITTVARYGVYLIRNFWPESIVKNVDNALDQLEKREQKQLIFPMDPKIELKYSTESHLRQLKRQNLLTTPRINEIILKYQLDLRNLNCNIENVTTSVIEANNNNQLRVIENMVNSQDFLAQQKRCEQILTPVVDQQHKAINNSDPVSENSEFINMLHPIVTINEIPSFSTRITSDTTEYSFIGNFNRTDSPSVPNDSSNQVDHQNVTQSYQNDIRRNESFAEPNTYKYYVSPVVHIIEGMNDSTISENGFADFKDHFTSYPKKASTPGNDYFNLSRPNSSLRKDEITRSMLKPPITNINSMGACNPDETSTITLISQISYEKGNSFNGSRKIAQIEENKNNKINQSYVEHLSEDDISKSQEKFGTFDEDFRVIDEVQTTFNSDTSKCANLNKNCKENLLNTPLDAISNQKSIGASQHDIKEADQDWNETSENEEIANQTCLEALISFEEEESVSETSYPTSSRIPNTRNKQVLLRANTCKKPNHVSIPNLDLNSSNKKLSSALHITPSVSKKPSNMFETSASKKLNKNKDLSYASIDDRYFLETDVSRTLKERHLDIASDPSSKSKNKIRDVSAEHSALETSVSNASKKRNLDTSSDLGSVNKVQNVFCTLNKGLPLETSISRASKNQNLDASDSVSLVPGNHDLSPASEKLDSPFKSINDGPLIPVTSICNDSKTSVPNSLIINQDLSQASVEKSSLETSISSTSKQRNFNSASDSGSKSLNKDLVLSHTSNGILPPETRISSISRQRPLHVSSDSDLSVPGNLYLSQASVEHCSRETSISSTSKKRHPISASDSGSKPIIKGLHLTHVSNEVLFKESSIPKTASYLDISRASLEKSISSASKIRNPNSALESGSKSLNKDLVLSHPSNKILPPETSISSASRQRRLHIASDPDLWVPGNQDLSQISVEHCSLEKSISSASKKPNLNSASDLGSKSLNKDLVSSHASNEIDPPETSISSASRKRRLDVASDPDISVPGNQIFSQASVEHCSRDPDMSQVYPETSISSASKKRNLNSASDSGSKSLNKDLVSSHASNEIVPPETSISSASRKRRLDVASDPEVYVEHSFPEANAFGVSKIGSAAKSINENQNLSFASDEETHIESDLKKRHPDYTSDQNTKIAKNILSSGSNDHSCLKTNESRAPKKRRLDYFSYPASKSLSRYEPASNKHKPMDETSISKSTSNESKKICKIKVKTKTNFKKFVPPRKLTIKQIKKDFEEQDKEIFVSSPTSSNISKYLESRKTRPTAQQIQDTTYWGTFKKIGQNGFLWWLPPESVKQKKRKQELRTFSNQNVDMSMFSDRNATAFEQFLNSNETDFRKIQSNDQNKTVYIDQKNENLFDYYMANTQNEKPGPSNANIQMTQDFLEQNKDDVNDTMNYHSADPRINIFESPYLSEDDLEL